MREFLEAVAAVMVIVLQVINVILSRGVDKKITEEHMEIRSMKELLQVHNTGSDKK